MYIQMGPFFILLLNLIVVQSVKENSDALVQLTTKVNNLENEYRRQISDLQREVETLKARNPCECKNVSKMRKGRITEEEGIAFTAYLSSSFNGQHFGTGHTVIYDVIETNEGKAYNNFTGSFTAPSDGLYAFNWIIIAGGSSGNHGEITIELVKNGQTHGVIDVDTERDQDDATSTGFAILKLKMRDVVFTRSPSFEHPEGLLRSDHFGRWSFSGWKLF